MFSVLSYTFISLFRFNLMKYKGEEKMHNFQNELQGLGIDPYRAGELVAMDPQSLDPRLHGGMRCGGGMGCGGGMRCGGGMGCGGMRCGGGFRCGGFRCGGFRCGGFSCIGFSCFGIGFSCGGCGGCGGCYSGYYDGYYNGYYNCYNCVSVVVV
ncbi:heterocycloanthracin/sonorensin family bacteriocin [Neobacillus sp. 114]|uniref:heterocycloanthracin/sonorensin family bacteriocin n=1 Tax=Neobacillus sp. 114 TaxID=3048535 RepID=UPI0024C376CC|nr:heterocycloanthracin/sonorensin family bacteriocin [Neobacillus sp. 114]